ncbi:extracellular solute-binding protein [Paenibacillus antri]|uniref:extracellular solute-binding protein n=1 Tax=Paenibacillus antri TaxID=2582848 RepID=UPI001EE3F71C|nr:extracellular solute-binding protein [Paenibacillus antri]
MARRQSLLAKGAAWAALSVLLTAGCANESGPAPVRGVSPATSATPTTLSIMVPGDRSPDFDLVMEEAERRMAEEGLHLDIRMEFVPWNDFGTRSEVALASGEEIDLIFDAPWLHLNEMIASGYYEPLDVMLEQYGETIVAKRPRQMWDANRSAGRVMAIPLGVSHVMSHSYFVRKDIRESLGVPPIRTYEELLRFAYLVKEKAPEVVPLIAGGTRSQQLYSQAAFRHYFDDTDIRPTQALDSSLMLYYRHNDGKVHNAFKEPDSPVRQWVEEARRLYVDGIMHKDVLGIKDFQEPGASGAVAIFPTGSFHVGELAQEKLRETVPDGELESVTFFDDTPGANVSDFGQWNFIAVPVVSKHKEEAVRFLNWANEKRNYDLLAYGLQGMHWEPLGGNKFKLLNTGYNQPAFVWIWNPTDDRLLADDARTEELTRFIRDADNFTPDVLTGFEFDGSSVQAELDRYNRIEAEYYTPLFNGVIDPASAWAAFEAEAGPALEAIERELQRQADAFMRK